VLDLAAVWKARFGCGVRHSWSKLFLLQFPTGGLPCVGCAGGSGNASVFVGSMPECATAGNAKHSSTLCPTQAAVVGRKQRVHIDCGFGLWGCTARK
jgi:hypothetical protein